MRNLRTCTALPIVVACLVLAGAADAATIAPLPPDSTVEGRRMDEWAALWWAWALGQARPNDAFSDTTGLRAGTNQSGPVYFLAVTPGGPATRAFTVPEGKHLYVPLSPLLAWGLPEAQMRAILAQENTDITLFASIDGQSVPDLFSYRITPPAGTTYAFDAVPNNAVFVPPGHHDVAVFEDWAMMVAPLPAGTYTLRYGSTDPSLDYTTDVTAVITVVPEPAAAGLIVAGAAFLLRRNVRGGRDLFPGAFDRVTQA